MKDVTYHESAVLYNKELADLAEELAERIPDAVVQTWCLAVAKQHRHHEKEHRAALVKLSTKAAEDAEKEQQDG